MWTLFDGIWNENDSTLKPQTLFFVSLYLINVYYEKTVWELMAVIKCLDLRRERKNIYCWN